VETNNATLHFSPDEPRVRAISNVTVHVASNGASSVERFVHGSFVTEGLGVLVTTGHILEVETVATGRDASDGAVGYAAREDGSADEMLVAVRVRLD